MGVTRLRREGMGVTRLRREGMGVTRLRREGMGVTRLRRDCDGCGGCPMALSCVLLCIRGLFVVVLAGRWRGVKTRKLIMAGGATGVALNPASPVLLLLNLFFYFLNFVLSCR